MRRALRVEPFNFAESTFVLPPEDPACTARVRIFTPRAEVDFAGHPTIGTAAVLATLGRMPTEAGLARARLEEGVRPVAVEVRSGDGPPHARLAMEPRLEVPGGEPSADVVAEALSISPGAVLDVTFASVGLRFCTVRLRDPEVVDAAALDRGAWARHLSSAWSSNLFFYAGNPMPGETLYARMFAPALGIEEDPATGSACATLAGLLAARTGEDGSFQWQVEQGVAMGRPSLIQAGAVRREGRLVEVSVAGHAVIAGTGSMYV